MHVLTFEASKLQHQNEVLLSQHQEFEKKMQSKDEASRKEIEVLEQNVQNLGNELQETKNQLSSQPQTDVSKQIEEKQNEINELKKKIQQDQETIQKALQKATDSPKLALKGSISSETDTDEIAKLNMVLEAMDAKIQKYKTKKVLTSFTDLCSGTTNRYRQTSCFTT